MRLPVSTAFVLALLSPTVFAAPATVVYRSGNWALEDNSTTCVAVNTASTNVRTLRLEIGHAKGSASPTEIFIRQKGGTVASWSINLANGASLAFPKMLNDAADVTFWGVPRATLAMMSQLEAKKDLKLAPGDGSRDPKLVFFAKGFTEVRREMQKRCLGGADVSNAEFEAAFLAGADRNVSPAAISPEVVDELRTLLTQGHTAFLKQTSNKAEIAQLRARFQAQLSEADSLNSTISRLQGSDIPATQAAQRNNDAREAAAQSNLVRLNASLPSLETAANNAASVLARAQSVLAPLQAEHDTRANNAYNARSLVVAGQNRIATINSNENDLNAQIRSLQSELARVQNSANNAQNQMYGARNDAQRAESDFRNFDSRRELERRLNSNVSYMQAQRELPVAEGRAREMDRQVDIARAESNARSQELRQCQARPSTPEAPVDCSAQMSTWQAADRKLVAAKDEARQWNSRASSLRIQISNIQQQASNDVERIRNDLGTRMANAQQRVNDLQQAINDAQQRASNITNYEIPSANNQINALERELGQVQADLRRNTPEANRLESELASYEQRVGWDAKVAAVDNAQAQLNARQTDLGSARSAKAQAEQTIAQAQATRTSLAQTLGQQQTQLSQAQTRLTQVNGSLVPFNTENDRLQAQATSLAAEFTGFGRQFEALLPN